MWSELDCLGRIYIAKEGINAQMSVPEHHLDAFMEQLMTIPGLENIPVKYAIEDDGKSFFKLTIKVRDKIVADGFDPEEYDFTNVGTHLSAIDFHLMSEDPENLVVDMRNHYEYEVGHFLNAHHPDADTFRIAVRKAVKDLSEYKNKNILLYCTGGIRCEKASAYFRHMGFNKVYQLHGGIIEYASQMKKMKLEPRFTGKNFVFDDRLGESIDGKVISNCHQCGKPCDDHTNCANDICHLLFIQCDTCREKNEGCCSDECREIMHMPEDKKAFARIEREHHYNRSKIYAKPYLMQVTADNSVSCN